jgi:hypothetical protein
VRWCRALLPTRASSGTASPRCVIVIGECLSSATNDREPSFRVLEMSSGGRGPLNRKVASFMAFLDRFIVGSQRRIRLGSLVDPRERIPPQGNRAAIALAIS